MTTPSRFFLFVIIMSSESLLPRQWASQKQILMQTLTGSLSVALMQRSPSAHCVSPEIETGEEKLAASSELGTRQHCRDNATKCPDQKMVVYCTVHGFICAATPFRQRFKKKHFSIYFLSLKLNSNMLLRCRCRKAKQLSFVQLSWSYRLTVVCYP